MHSSSALATIGCGLLVASHVSSTSNDTKTASLNPRILTKTGLNVDGKIVGKDFTDPPPGNLHPTAAPADERKLASTTYNPTEAVAKVKKSEEDRLVAAAEAKAKMAEEDRVAAEIKAKKAEEGRLVAEAKAKKAEADMLAAEAKKAEEDRLAAAEAKKAEEKRLAANNSFFASTSTNPEVAKGFITRDDGVLFKLTLTSGKDVNDYSFYPAEGEILISPNHRFSVSSAPYEVDGFTVVDMVQLVNSTFVT